MYIKSLILQNFRAKNTFGPARASPKENDEITQEEISLLCHIYLPLNTTLKAAFTFLFQSSPFGMAFHFFSLTDFRLSAMPKCIVG
jgi:hypothetical protein